MAKPSKETITFVLDRLSFTKKQMEDSSRIIRDFIPEKSDKAKELKKMQPVCGILLVFPEHFLLILYNWS